MPETAQFVYGALGIAYELTGEFFQTIKYYTQNLAILKEWATWRFLPKEVGARCANLGNAYQSRAEQRFDSLKECRLPHRGDENDSRKRMQTKHPKTCLPRQHTMMMMMMSFICSFKEARDHHCCTAQGYANARNNNCMCAFSVASSTK